MNFHTYYYRLEDTMSNEIPETEVLTEDDQIASILENLPAETEIDVEVPSRGIT